jgi:copper(I)-binding protein
MVVVDGLMEMREVTGMTIPANGQINFEPGGKHLMLMGPKEHLKTGQKVDMTLVFKSGKKQTVSIQVAAK